MLKRGVVGAVAIGAALGGCGSSDHNTKAAPQATPLVASEAKAVLAGITAAGADCDATSARLRRVSGDAYRLYPLFIAAQKSCEKAAGAVQSVGAPPSASGDVLTAFREAITTCQLAYAYKGQAYGTMAKFTNGDARPSVMSEAQEKMGTAQQNAAGCAAQLVAASAQGGVDANALAERPGATSKPRHHRQANVEADTDSRSE